MILPSHAVEESVAKAQGYRSMTQAYALPAERPLLDNVMRDMDRGKIDYILVGGQSRPSVWRKGMKLIESGVHT